MNADAFIGGMMMVGAAASAVTGGAAASGGQTIVTGESSASVQVTNVVNSNDEGGTSHTIIEKTINGVKEVTEEKKNVAPGEPVIVEVEATAISDSKAMSSTSGEEIEDTEASSTESSSSTTATQVEAEWSLSSYIAKTVSGFFASVWSLFSN